MRRFDCHNRLKQVKRDYEALLRTMAAFAALTQQQPHYLYENNITQGDLRRITAELHDIYFAKLFACFESSIRHYWRSKIRNTKPNTEVLLLRVAERLGVPQDELDIVNEVRDFRNFLIHEEHELKRRVTMDEAGKSLNTYLARLPLEW